MEKQAKLILHEDEEAFAGAVRELVTHPIVLIFVIDLPILSFFVANYVIFHIVNLFWKLNLLCSTFIFIIGFVISLAIIKPNYFLDFDGFRKRMKKCVDKLTTHESYPLPKVSLSEFFSFSLRNVFFNMLNDSFVLLIFWLTIYAGAILLNFSNLPSENEFRLFSETMALIGIISGLFQFYVKEYKEKNSNIIRSLIEKRLSETKKISFVDFRNYLLDKNLNSFVSTLDKIIGGRYIQVPGSLSPFSITKKERNEFIAFNNYNQIYRPIDLNNIQLFGYFENYACGHSELRKTDLLHHYESYFSAKRDNIKKIDETQKIRDLRRLMFSAIFFSDEVFYSYLSTISSLPKRKDKPESFMDFFNNFAADCVFDLFSDVIFYKPKNSINDYFENIMSLYGKYRTIISIVSGIIILSLLIYLVPQNLR